MGAAVTSANPSDGPVGAAAAWDSGLAGLLDELRWRGMLHEATPGLAERLANGHPIAGYIGFDPSAASLHVGHLVPIFGLLQLQRHGGRPVAVVGGGTGMIGDPSGRSSERNLLDRATLAANTAAIRVQLARFLDFAPGPGAAVLVDNNDWLAELSLVEFLRDTGKHFTIPYMLAKDSVQARLERGLSFTEFSYMLLQAYDFAHLNRTRGVELQMGGADQWGNITAGLELIRRTRGAPDDDPPAFALAYPLLLSPSGTKFGKSERGDTVWLDPTLTSPFRFYQYWLNTDDRDVPVYLRWFTLFERPTIESLEAALAAHPEAREAQRALALDITARAHGLAAADRVRRASEAAFSREPLVDPQVLEVLHEESGHRTFRPGEAPGAASFLASTGLVSSRGEARRLIANGGLTINDRRIADAAEPLPEPVAGEWMVVRRGRRALDVLRVERSR